MSTTTEQVLHIVTTIRNEERSFPLSGVGHWKELTPRQLLEYLATGDVASYWGSEQHNDDIEFARTLAVRNLLAEFAVVDEDGNAVTDETLPTEDLRTLEAVITALNADNPLTHIAEQTVVPLRVAVIDGLDTDEISKWDPAGEEGDPALHAMEAADIYGSEENIARLRYMAGQQPSPATDLVALFGTDAHTAARLNTHGGTLTHPHLYLWDGAAGVGLTEPFDGDLAVSPGTLIADDAGEAAGLCRTYAIQPQAFDTTIAIDD